MKSASWNLARHVSPAVSAGILEPFHGEAFAHGLGGIVGSAAGVQACLLRLKILGTGVILLQFAFINMSLVGLVGRHSRCPSSLNLSPASDHAMGPLHSDVYLC